MAPTWFAIAGYGICSSLMLVVNKLAVHYLPAPSFVLLIQFIASFSVVKAFGVCGVIEVDALEWSKLRAFLPISAAFVACVYANIKTLQFGNVRDHRRRLGRRHGRERAGARTWLLWHSGARRRGRGVGPRPRLFTRSALCCNGDLAARTLSLFPDPSPTPRNITEESYSAAGGDVHCLPRLDAALHLPRGVGLPRPRAAELPLVGLPPRAPGRRCRVRRTLYPAHHDSRVFLLGLPTLPLLAAASG